MKTAKTGVLPFRVMAMLILAFCMSACVNDDAATLSVLTGPEVTVGNGRAWSEVTYDDLGEPTGVHIVMTPEALDDLPSGHHPPAHEFLITLPPGSGVPPFDHLTLDWNAHGHAPPGVYDAPHFDFHFYFIDMAERDAIGPNDSTEFNRPLPAEHLPPMYAETPGGVPRMGAHVIDLISPEIAGTGPFTHTFIYGKYDGALTFLEPMAALSFLRDRPNVTVPIRQPQTYGRSGYFPETYTIRYDANDDLYRIGLTDLTLR